MAAKRKTTATKKKTTKKKTAKRKSTSLSANYSFAETIDISNINSFYDDLRSLLGKSKKVKIDAGKLKWIDTSGMQLLCCWFQEAKKKGVDVSWKNTDGTFMKSATLLGLADNLELN